jgi:glycosyltransferase involved in cell wall biosynthesis
VVVPAKNEGKNVEACLRGLQQQTYSNLEIILVNDRSTDDTGAVMERYASMFPNWHYIEIKELPDGWLGKNHALHKGGIKATGDYIVFTDGDVIITPLQLKKQFNQSSRTIWIIWFYQHTLKGDGPLSHCHASAFHSWHGQHSDNFTSWVHLPITMSVQAFTIWLKHPSIDLLGDTSPFAWK